MNRWCPLFRAPLRLRSGLVQGRASRDWSAAACILGLGESGSKRHCVKLRSLDVDMLLIFRLAVPDMAEPAWPMELALPLLGKKFLLIFPLDLAVEGPFRVQLTSGCGRPCGYRFDNGPPPPLLEEGNDETS